MQYREDVDVQLWQNGYNTLDLISERQVMDVRNAKGELLALDDFANFLAFDEKGVAVVTKQGSSLEIRNRNGFLQFMENGAEKAFLDANTYFMPATRNFFHQIESDFNPPTFGLTFLGTSHG